MFKECYALEKIHGSSAWIKWKNGQISFYAGGCKHEQFVNLFNSEHLSKVFIDLFGNIQVFVYGEVYGGKMQGMKTTYGPNLKFVVFDVKIEDSWLSVPQAEDVAKKLGLEFVYYIKVSTDLAELDKQRDADSVQAIRNGMGVGHYREGVVLRPLIELVKNNGERIIVKHKREEFKEREHVPKIVDPEKMEIMTKAQAIADEWVIQMRLEHVLQKLPDVSDIKDTGKVIKAMIEDVYREAKGEIVESKEVSVAISKKTAQLFKKHIMKVDK